MARYVLNADMETEEVEINGIKSIAIKTTNSETPEIAGYYIPYGDDVYSFRNNYHGLGINKDEAKEIFDAFVDSVSFK